jgi:hypothetical protein
VDLLEAQRWMVRISGPQLVSCLGLLLNWLRQRVA